ncbi:hypothetical protein V1264_023855 [Littorina saxatilis]|uniref:Uncharacterized protein n=1 Tax=Littorina saxatilis TaxID=31220 RepID=A0AAN9B846_9CAEN
MLWKGVNSINVLEPCKYKSAGGVLLNILCHPKNVLNDGPLISEDDCITDSPVPTSSVTSAETASGMLLNTLPSIAVSCVRPWNPTFLAETNRERLESDESIFLLTSLLHRHVSKTSAKLS